MRVLRFSEEAARAITQHGSRGFLLSPLLAGTLPVHVVYATLQPGGVIGRHPTVSEQLLLLVGGEAIVEGADRTPRLLRAGEAALFAAGEMHETRSEAGASAIILEGAGLESALL